MVTAADDRVALRRVDPDDLATFFEDQNEPLAAEMAAVQSRDRPSFDAHWHRILEDRSVLVRSVWFDGELAGYVVRWAVEGLPHIGYWISRRFWGLGVASRAVEQFVAQAGERPLFARVSPGNEGSLQVLRKCGFVRHVPTAGSKQPLPDDDELVMVLNARPTVAPRTPMPKGPTSRSGLRLRE